MDTATLTSAFRSQVPSFDCSTIPFTKMAFNGVESGSGVGTFHTTDGYLLGGLLNLLKYESKIVGDRLVTNITQSGLQNKEMVHQAWKAGEQICESLAVAAGKAETVQKCYLGKFDAFLLQATCDIKTNYYPLVGGVIAAVGLYGAKESFQSGKQNYAYGWLAVMIVGFAVIGRTLHW